MMSTHNDRSPDTTALYAWISRDADGIEGIIAAPVGEFGITPLVTADEGRARRLQPFAELASAMREFPARLVKFERAETILTVGE